MYIYNAYNLCIHSEIPLPELIASEGEADVIIRLGKLDDKPKGISESGNSVLGDIKGIGNCLIEYGRRITIEPVAGVNESMLSPSILGAAMCVILRQRGLLVLHASCVAINNKAVAFIGNSGWGKSTLAASFHTQGYDVLTDDVMPVKIDAGHPVVIPAFPQFKLCPDAVDSLGHNTKELSPLFHKASKLSYKFTHGFQQNPLPLQRIYVLNKGTRHEITKLQPQEAFAEVVRHTRSVNVLKTPDFLTSHMRQCANLIKNVSFCRFTRQPSLAALPELVNLVLQDLAQDNSDCWNSTHESAANINFLLSQST